MTNMYLVRKQQLVYGDNAGPGYLMELEYYLSESEADYGDELAGKKIYGIGIIKKSEDKCNEGMLIIDFSSCISRTKEVLKKLASNSVTPIALQSVLEDLVSV